MSTNEPAQGGSGVEAVTGEQPDGSVTDLEVEPKTGSITLLHPFTTTPVDLLTLSLQQHLVKSPDVAVRMLIAVSAEADKFILRRLLYDSEAAVRDLAFCNLAGVCMAPDTKNEAVTSDSVPLTSLSVGDTGGYL